MEIEHKSCASMSIGEKFSSFLDFQRKLKIYEEGKKQKFWIRNSRTLSAARKIGITRSCIPELKYYEIQYTCIHGGLKFKSRGTGERSTKTFKKGCPAFIRLKATKDGQSLVIVNILENHLNHPNSELLFDHLPQVRRLAPKDEENVKSYLRLGCNKKLIQNELINKGKKTTLKDLANIGQNSKADECNDLEFCVGLLQDYYRADVHVLHEDNYFKGLFFSIQEMRQALNAWPEFVALDGTYKLLNNDLTVYIFLIEDAGGNSEIAGVGLLASEDRDSIHWLLNTFKIKNVATENIKCFMTDKDLLQRDVIKKVFPQVATYICLFHTLRSFSREVSCQKLNITQSERTTSLELLTKLVYSSSNEEYDRLYEVFSEQAPSTVLLYFNKNWHPIKDEWTVCNMKNGNLNNRTNNRLESINNKIKQVVAKNSSFCSFLKSFFSWLNSFYNERNNRLAKEFLKASVSIFKPGSVEDQYSKLLTNYAYTYILKNLKQSMYHVSFTQQNNIFQMEHNNNIITVSENHCTCTHFSSMFLPCKHIFVIRRNLNRSLYCPELCHKRWTKQYYFHNSRHILEQSNDLPISDVHAIDSSQKKYYLYLKKDQKLQIYAIKLFQI